MMRAIAKHCCVSRAALKELAQIAFMGRVKETGVRQALEIEERVWLK
jgi:hypothetical protein